MSAAFSRAGSNGPTSAFGHKEGGAGSCETRRVAYPHFHANVEPDDSLPWVLEDLTAAACAGEILPAVDVELPHVATAATFDAGETSNSLQTPGASALPLFLRLARCLTRRGAFHVVLVGDRGVGKTTVLRELARRAFAGELPRLNETRFVRLEAGLIPPHDAPAVLAAVLSQAAACSPAARSRSEDVDPPVRPGSGPRLVICLDGLAPLLKGCDGRTRVAEFLTGLRRARVPVIAVLSRAEHNELLAGHAEVRELATRIDIEEPSDETTAAILAQHALKMAATEDVTIPAALLPRTASLASSYLLNERQPAKSVRVLRTACENFAFERRTTVAGAPPSDATAPLAPHTLTEAALLEVLSDLTGIPHETIAGTPRDADFDAALAAEVLGQTPAVATVANELRLIRSGLTESDKPASVLLFAGLTGVGKTELAKAVAGIYSGSKRLNVYAMGNFTEPHCVSGILGVPPGYVGHEHGGRLINELNADPYAVFLLDEAEKAHPNVWKPFLNLFDEGWIEDPRGVRAYADRAIFILTTNAGSDSIAQMTHNGAGNAEIEERVKSTLARVKHERSAQPVFTPQFLARMKRVLVFRPLDEPAMTGIARKLVGQVQKLWQQKRDQRLEVDERLIEWIGREAHALNQKSGNKEGARLIRKLIRDTIESPAQQQLVHRGEADHNASTIHIETEPPAEGAPQGLAPHISSHPANATAPSVRVRLE